MFYAAPRFALALLVLLFVGASADAADLSWDGIFRLELVDDGTGIYKDAIEDSSQFSGVFVYGDSCTGSCIVEPFPPDAVNYVFPDGVGIVTGLGITTVGVESSVEIEDEHVVDAGEAALATALGYPVSAGAIIDVWTVGSETSGAALEWEAAFIYDTTNPFSSTAYTATAPPNPDLVIFQIDEGQETIYLGFGDVTTVPEPGSSVLLGAGCLGLLFLARGRRTDLGGRRIS